MICDQKILTVDLEEWFHLLDTDATKPFELWDEYPSRIADQTYRLLDLFNKYDVTATFFVLGYIASKYPELIQEIKSQNHEIASHGYSHELAFEQSQEQFKKDITRSIEAISGACGSYPNAYTAPGFSIGSKNLRALEVLSECGFEIDCSVFPATRAHGGLSEFNYAKPCLIELKNGRTIKEFPMSTNSFFGKKIVISGGGYFRITPFRLIKYYLDRSDYLMTYFHPRDFDYEQPRISGLTTFRYFKTYVGLSNSLSKLDKLLENSLFVSLKAADASTDWQSVKSIELSKIKIS